MIIRCQDGRLLNAEYVVDWCNEALPVEPNAVEDDNAEPLYSINATRIDGTTVKVFTGTENDCYAHLDEIHTLLSQESHEVRVLYRALLKRTDKLDNAIRKFVAASTRRE